SFAKAYLQTKGYSVLAERFKTKLGEIDLIVRKGDTIVFVEVKWRQTMAAAAESVHKRNQSRVFRAAELYLQQHPEYSGYEMRFDALLLAPGVEPEHIENAWGA